MYHRRAMYHSAQSTISQRQPSALYDRIAPFYDQTRWLPKDLPERLADTTLRLVDVNRPPQMLEIGVGTGRIAHGFLRPGLVTEYVGLDASAAMLEILRHKFSYQITPVLGDASCLPFKDDCFDVVISCHVLHMVPDLPAALTEIQRVLRPGGHYVHCTDELAPHQQEFDQTWQRLLTEEDPASRPTVRYDMCRDDVVSLWASKAAWTETVEVARWQSAHRVGDLLAAYQAKAYPSCHRVSERAFDRAFARLRQECHAADGGLNRVLSSTSRMDIAVIRTPELVSNPTVAN
jgi:ubiquinone/menaquinone biosynthesis C-methylase UbiE